MLGGMVLMVSPGGALLVLMLGAPALFIMVADTTPRHSLTRTVFLFSLAGVIQPVRTFLMEGHDISTALRVLARPESILFAWICAGSGWLLNEIFCLMAVFMTNVRLNTRRKSLEATLLEIRKEWERDQHGSTPA